MANEPVRIERTYNGVFVEPAFAFADWAKAYETLFRTFSPAVTAQGIKWESTSNHPSDLSLVCTFADYNTYVRFRFTAVEIWSHGIGLLQDAAGFLDAVRKTVGVMKGLTNLEHPFASHAFSIGVHWRPEGGLAKGLERWTHALPPGFSPSRVAFWHEVPIGRVTIENEASRVVTEPPGEHEFSRVLCEIKDGTKEPDVIYDVVNEVMTAALQTIGIEGTK